MTSPPDLAAAWLYKKRSLWREDVSNTGSGGGSTKWDCFYIAFKPATSLPPRNKREVWGRDTFSWFSDFLDTLPQKGEKVEMPVFSSRRRLFGQQAAKQHTEACQFGKRGFSALCQRQGGTFFSFLATFVKTKRWPPSTQCAFPLGWPSAPRGP